MKSHYDLFVVPGGQSDQGKRGGVGGGAKDAVSEAPIL